MLWFHRETFSDPAPELNGKWGSLSAGSMSLSLARGTQRPWSCSANFSLSKENLPNKVLLSNLVVRTGCSSDAIEKARWKWDFKSSFLPLYSFKPIFYLSSSPQLSLSLLCQCPIKLACCRKWLPKRHPSSTAGAHNIGIGSLHTNKQQCNSVLYYMDHNMVF